MAKATANTVTTTTKALTLELSLEEAQTLADILSLLGGPATASRRRHTDAISKSMASQGINFTFMPQDISGSLYFKNAPVYTSPGVTWPTPRQ